MEQATRSTGSAARWGPLWGARPREWAASEEQQRPTYEAALEWVPVEAGDRVLDVGCGTGVFLGMALDRGAEPHGLDASEALLALARERVPGADLRAGDMESLPWPDDHFDVVTGFNSFFFAADLVAALREAGRVARPGRPVVIQVWGPPERNDLEAMKAIVRRYAPPPPPGAPEPPELWRQEVLEELARRAGLAPRDAFATAWAYEFPDASTLASRLMAPAGLASLVEPGEEEAVRAEIVETLAPYRAADGSYRLTNEFRFLVATA